MLLNITNSVAYVNIYTEMNLDKLLYTIYIVVISNFKGERMVTEAKEKLKKEIENITDEAMIEKIWIFVMGILAQQGIERRAAGRIA